MHTPESWPWLVGAAFALVGCHRVPAPLRPSLERHRATIEALAVSAGARCPELRSGGLAALVNGTVPDSPARGTALEPDAEVLQVGVSCYWPIAGGGTGGVGGVYRPLRAPTERRSGDGQTYTLSGREEAHTLEEVLSPAVQVSDAAAFDVHVQRPTPSGGWIDLVVTLKPGNTTLAPPPPQQRPVRGG